MAKPKMNLMPMLMAFHKKAQQEGNKVENYEKKKGMDSKKEEKKEKK